MYESWKQDYVEKNESERYFAILNGAFSNHEMAQKMIDDENPDYSSSDADFEASTQMMMNDIEKQKERERSKPRRRRRRKK